VTTRQNERREFILTVYEVVFVGATTSYNVANAPFAIQRGVSVDVRG